jgi:hypothetical protein
MARPPRFGPGHRPLLRQKKHARRLNKRTSVKIAGRVGTVISRTLLTVNINMISRSESRRRAISGESESWEPVHDGSSPRRKPQVLYIKNRVGSTHRYILASATICRIDITLRVGSTHRYILAGATICHIDKTLRVGSTHRFFVACDTMSH